MNLKSIVAILVVAAVPVCAQAQKPAKVTKEDAQKVFEIISGDKAKPQAYCDLGKLGDQMAEANEEKDSKKVVSESGRIAERTGARIYRVNERTSGHRPGLRGRSGDHFDNSYARQVVFVECGGTHENLSRVQW
jgi:hypothetical protein